MIGDLCVNSLKVKHDQMIIPLSFKYDGSTMWMSLPGIGFEELVEQAIECYGLALSLNLLGVGDLEATAALSYSLVTTLFRRFEHTGYRPDLDGGIKHQQCLHELGPPDHFGHIDLNNLSTTILTRFEVAGNPADLAKAILPLEEVEALTQIDNSQPVHPHRAIALNNCRRPTVQVSLPQVNEDFSVTFEPCRYRKLSADWTETVKSIRAVDGFESFLLPTPFPTLRLAAVEGPVIVVNLSSDARTP